MKKGVRYAVDRDQKFCKQSAESLNVNDAIISLVRREKNTSEFTFSNFSTGRGRAGKKKNKIRSRLRSDQPDQNPLGRSQVVSEGAQAKRRG